jgi:hypothetical protein
VSVKRLKQVGESSSGVSDSVENSQQQFDAKESRSDATQGRRYRGILIRKNRPQIQQHAPLINPGNDGRL